tara:strand:- start:60 stop:356 length:297 start_codon:yes stop_codon:yes gene_type:complete
MIIYGVALLAACMLAGNIIGELIGMAIGVSSNVGGVGLAMLLLVFVVYRLQKAGCLDTSSRRGVEFWSSLYIPSWLRWRPARTWWALSPAGRSRLWAV